MTCKNCGAMLTNETEDCPVCGAPIQKLKHPGAVRLIVGIAVLLVVCLCTIISHHLQYADQNALQESETKATITLVDPDSENDDLENSLADAAESCAFTNAESIVCGTYARLSMTKQALQNLGDAGFAELWNSFLNKNELYITICLENGCGLVFSKGNRSTAMYGTLDKNCYISEVHGIVLRKDDGTFQYCPTETATEARSTAQVANVIPSTDTVTSENSLAATTATISSANAPDNKGSTTGVMTGNIVYVTSSGKKYHRADCSYLHASKTAISVSDAIAQGYTACSRCNP